METPLKTISLLSFRDAISLCLCSPPEKNTLTYFIMQNHIINITVVINYIILKVSTHMSRLVGCSLTSFVTDPPSDESEEDE